MGSAGQVRALIVLDLAGTSVPSSEPSGENGSVAGENLRHPRRLLMTAGPPAVISYSDPVNFGRVVTYRSWLPSPPARVEPK